MNTLPGDLDTTPILAALEAGWGLVPADLQYTALGFGSHHWTATGPTGERWFVTVDDLRGPHLGRDENEAFVNLDTAFRTALALHEGANLRFVIGPLRTTQGDVLSRLDGHYAMSLFPFLDVIPGSEGVFASRADRDDAMRLIGQVHNATGSVGGETLRRDTLAVLGRDRFVDALRSLDAPWRGGPYAEPARKLLRDHARSLLAALERFDALAASVMKDSSGWVITHGEPHAANVIRTCTGSLVIVDWDTVAYGPRERDMWTLFDGPEGDWSAYRETTGTTSLSGDAMDAYRLHWDLSEIAVYTDWCRTAEARTEDMEIAWDELRQYVQNT